MIDFTENQDLENLNLTEVIWRNKVRPMARLDTLVTPWAPPGALLLLRRRSSFPWTHLNVKPPIYTTIFTISKNDEPRDTNTE
jgi:hypothetical protein